MKFEEMVYWNQKNRTYGNAIRINKKYIQRTLFVIAVLPLFTAWIFPLIPFVKDFVWRY